MRQEIPIQKWFEQNIDYQKKTSGVIKSYNQRKMTDVICLWLYCFLTIIVISSFFYSFIMEKQKNIFRPKDPNGRRCGEGQANSYPFIYFPSPFSESISKSVCVKDCPTSTTSVLDCLFNTLVSDCTYNITDHFNRSNQFIMYPTEKNMFLSMCQPSSDIIFDAINSKINTYQLFQNLQIIYQSLKIILIACPIVSITLVALYVFLLTRLDDLTPVFKGSVVIFIVCLLAFSMYSFTTSAKAIFAYMPYLGIGVFVITVLIIIFLFTVRQYIQRSLNLLNMGVQYIRQNRSLIFSSLVLFLLWIIVFLLQFFAIVFIYSIDSRNEPSQMNQPLPFAYFIGIQNSLFVKILLTIAIVHYFWTNLILYNAGQYICMAAGSYWILNVQHNFKNALFTLLRFHLGTVIFGSITYTTIGKLSTFLYFIMPHENEKIFGLNCRNLSKFYKTNCFKRFLGVFYDLNYILVALQGFNFIKSGQKLTQTLIKYLNHVSRAYRLARVTVFISKMLMALATTLICYSIILLTPTMRGYFLTNIIIFIFSSFLTSFAFESYDRSFQVILITILINREKNIRKNGNYRLTHVQNQSQRTKKRDLYEEIQKWFDEQKKRQQIEVQKSMA